MLKAETMGVLKVKVTAENQATLSLSLEDYAPDAWTREIAYTDLPEGEWTFYVVNEPPNITMILPSEY